MPFSAVVGHAAAIRALQRALLAERLPTGYLFVGPPHLGKTTLAKAFAQAANCEQPRQDAEGLPDACGECPTCVRIEQETYRDAQVIRPRRKVKVDAGGETEEEAFELQAELDDALIDVKLIERLRMDAAASSVEARRRVYLLTQAENMNAEAANRFLKTLEEPAPRTTFVLTSAQPSRLLPTIISRCQTLTLHPLHGAELREALAARWPQLPESRREQIAALSGGAFGRALRLVETPELLALRGKVLDLLAALPRREPWEALRQGELLLELTEQWWLAEQPGDLGRDFLKHAHDAAVRAKLGDVLHVMHSWFRDLLALERPELLTNPDYRPQLEAAARRYPPASALAANQVLEELRADLGQNPNLRLAAETLFIRLLAARRA